jgi:hypothetical protein
MEKDLIKARLIADNKQIERAWAKQRKTCKEAIKLVQSTDVDKRLELIDYLFADKVDELIEFHLRKNYQIIDLGFGELK